MSTNTKDISFYLYAEILMNKLQSIGNSVEPYTTRASDENNVQQDIINVQQDLQQLTQAATTGGSNGKGNTAVTEAMALKFANDVNKLGTDAKALQAFETANPSLNDGLGDQAMSTYNMIINTSGTFTSGPHPTSPTDPTPITYNNPVGNPTIGADIAAALAGNATDLINDMVNLGNYYFEQKFPVPPATPPTTPPPPADLGPLDDWVNNGYNGGVSTSALDTNLGAAVNTNNNQLNTWSTLIQQLDQVAQNVITSLSSLWGTEVSNTSPSLMSAS